MIVPFLLVFQLPYSIADDDAWRIRLMFSFDHSYLFSRIWESNDYFTQYFQPALSHVAALNFMALHLNPSLDHFKLLEAYQQKLHLDLGQDFLRFHWPADQGIFPETFSYLSQAGYGVGKIAFLQAAPKQVKVKPSSIDLRLEPLQVANEAHYLQANFQADLDHGQAYAQDKQKQYAGYIKRPHLHPILAYFNQQLIGWVDLILSPAVTEIHSLYVVEAYRQQGVGSALIQQACDLAAHRQQALILLADLEDYPYHIYLKQGFEDRSQFIVAEKVSTLS